MALFIVAMILVTIVNFAMIQYLLHKVNQLDGKLKDLAWKVGRTSASASDT